MTSSRSATIACDDADADVGVTDTGVLRCDDYVAKKGEGGAQADGVAVDGSNYGLGDFQEVSDQLAGALKDPAVDVFTEGVGVAGPVLHALNVSAGREGLAGACDYHGVDLGVLGEEGEELFELMVHPVVDGVEGVGAVQGDEGYGILDGNFDG